MPKKVSDTILMRRALRNAGFEHTAEHLIYNDLWKSRKVRRLKIVGDREIKVAPLDEQMKLWNQMIQMFNGRIIKVAFSDTDTSFYQRYPGMTVYLKT